MAEVLDGGRAHSTTECIGDVERAGLIEVDDVDVVPGTLTRTVGSTPG